MTNSLKEAICENLTTILSPDNAARENAEQQLRMLETNDDFGLYAMEISLSENLEFPIRQLAAVLLTQYIKTHWSESSGKFQPPEVNPAIKHLIKEYLLKSLNISSDLNMVSGITKLMKSYAHAISNIALVDWPEQWPQLFPVLISYLSSGSPNAIYSSLKVFRELSYEITDIQIPNIAPLLLPQMLNILVSDQFSIRTRTNAIKVFSVISETIMHMNKVQSNSIKIYLAEHIPRFAESVISILMLPDGSANVDIGLKTEIIVTLNLFLRYCKKGMKIYTPKVLELIWHNLTTSANIYVKENVNSSDDCHDGTGTAVEDSDDETVSFENYVLAILNFVSSLVKSNDYLALIKPVLSDLLYYIIFFLQIPDEKAEAWLNDLDLFIEQTDIEDYSFTLRVDTQDLILEIARRMTTVNEAHPKKDDELFKLALLQAINRHFAEASELEKQQKVWWQSVESCLLTIGLLAPTIIVTINSTQPFADQYKSILDNVLTNQNISEPFLAGRSLWTASRYSQIMNDQSLNNFLKLTSNLLNTVEAPILRVYSLRATYYFMENVQSTRKVEVMKPYLNQFLQGLVSFGAQCKEKTLALLLEVIDLMLDLDTGFTASVSSSICSMVISTILNYSDNAGIFDQCLMILEKLFQSEQCNVEVYERIVSLVDTILAADANNSIQFGAVSFHNANVLKPLALEILTKLLQHNKHSLPDVFVQKVFPSLINCIQRASFEDSAIFQNGSDCLRLFISKHSEQLGAFVDPATNQNGISLTLGVCNYLLTLKASDSASAFIGQLIVVLILKTSHLIGHENIESLLRSALVRLNTCKQLPVTQGLILVFAHLIYTDLPTILQFLSSLPAPDGNKSALEFVLNKWLGIQLYFHGYACKASTIALCQLFKHSLQQQLDSPASGSDSINLHQIEVVCKDAYSDGGGDEVQTRSKTALKEKQQATVPCTVKILKLLINEVLFIQESKSQDNDEVYSSEDEEEEEGDGEDEESDSKLIDFEEFDDDDVLSEEIHQIDLESVTKKILTEFRHHPIASHFLPYLTRSESTLLESI